jgi:hypothetical protein
LRRVVDETGVEVRRKIVVLVARHLTVGVVGEFGLEVKKLSGSRRLRPVYDGTNR